jgi:Uncharacterized protein conserved in bacteria (DUF2344)
VPESPEPPVRHPTAHTPEAVQRWRLVVRRDALDADQVQRAQQAAWEVSLRACGLPVAGLAGDAGRPRFALAAPLAPAYVGEAELADVWLTERRPRWAVREALDGALPDGSRLLELFDVWLGESALPGRVVASSYRASIEDAPAVGSADQLRAAAAGLLEAVSVPRERARGERTVLYDLRPFIDDVAIRERNGAIEIVMELRHDPEKGVGRPEEVLAELAERSGIGLGDAILVRERLVLAPDRRERR